MVGLFLYYGLGIRVSST